MSASVVTSSSTPPMALMASADAAGTVTLSASFLFTVLVEPPSAKADDGKNRQAVHLSSCICMVCNGRVRIDVNTSRHRFGGHQQLPRWQLQFLRRRERPEPLPPPPPDLIAQAAMKQITPIVITASIEIPPRLCLCAGTGKRSDVTVPNCRSYAESSSFRNVGGVFVHDAGDDRAFGQPAC